MIYSQHRTLCFMLGVFRYDVERRIQESHNRGLPARLFLQNCKNGEAQRTRKRKKQLYGAWMRIKSKYRPVARISRLGENPQVRTCWGVSLPQTLLLRSFLRENNDSNKEIKSTFALEVLTKFQKHTTFRIAPMW